jgi:L-ascorbate metabolism protein UlaG (beta-lactamase superfamily)
VSASRSWRVVDVEGGPPFTRGHGTRDEEEAAKCVNAFKPKVVYPFHYRGSDLQVFQKAVTEPGIEIRLGEFYPNGQER